MSLDVFQQASLLDCMHQPGCPICRATWKMDTAQFGWYVNDGVLDEETQRRVIRALGFCPPHALSLAIIEGSDFLWSHLGSCMVYVNVIEHALLPNLERFLFRSGQWFLQPFRLKVFSPLRHLFHHNLCLLCFDHRQHEATYREQFAEAFSTNADFRQAYLQADSLCVPHFQQVRAILSEQSMVHLLEHVEAHALELCQQAQTSDGRNQLWQCLALLYGADTLFWSDFTPRAAISTSDAGPAPCLACQESGYETSQLSAPLLDRLEEVFQFEEEHRALSVCSWHAWWLLHQGPLQPAGVSRLAPLLQRTCGVLLPHLESTKCECRPCDICAWTGEQEIMQVGKLQHKLRDSEQRVPLCLRHARAALRQPSDEATAHNVAYALMYTVAPLARRLEAYIYKCTERFQDQMQPHELVAWFDAIQWFGGSSTAQLLLAPSPSDPSV